MGTHYSHLTEHDRLVIDTLLMSGHSQRSVARSLGFSPSTISREVKRATQPGCWRYFSVFGQQVRNARRRRAGIARRKLDHDLASPRWQAVLVGLHTGWSPEQTAGRLKLMGLPSSVLVSHETIYRAIYAMPRGSLRTQLVTLLRRSHRGRLPRARGSNRFTGLQNMKNISERPPEVADRLVPGHLEADLIKGARNASAVGTIVERVSRHISLVKLDGCDSQTVLDGFTRRLRRLPKSMRKTVTYDQGTEMAQHQTLAKRLRINIFFCDPHSPWQRGSNENANGLIRQYLPKGTDLSTVTQRQLSSIEDTLNNRPRKILGFRTPAEVFASLSVLNNSSVALQA